MDLDGLEQQVNIFERLCLALPECDGKGKLRGKLGRVRTSLADCVEGGDLAGLNEDVKAAESLVRQLHAQHPLTQLLQKLSALRVALQDGRRDDSII